MNKVCFFLLIISIFISFAQENNTQEEQIYDTIIALDKQEDNEIAIRAGLAYLQSQQRIQETDPMINSEPFNTLMNQLRSKLSTHQISSLKQTSIYYQGLTFGYLVQFTYLQNGIYKNGEALAINEYGSSLKSTVFEIKLQDEESEEDKDWINYPISNYGDFQDDPTSSLFIMKTELEKQLADLRVLFISFVDIKTRLNNENQYKIKLYALNYEGEVEIATCFASVKQQEQYVQITNLTLKAYQSSFNLQKKNPLGNWSDQSYESPIKLESNMFSSNSHDIADSSCYGVLEENKIENVYISKKQIKLLRSIFGFVIKLHFISIDSKGRETQSGSCLFAFIDTNGWGKQHQLVKIVELQTLS